MKILCFFLITITCIACNSSNLPSAEPDNMVTAPHDTIIIGDSVWDNTALIGKWHPYNYHHTYIIEDGVIYLQYDDNEPHMTHRYTNYGNVLHIERLHFTESHPSRFAYCEYRINYDTLYIKNFSQTISAIDPPIFKDVTLIKIKE